MRHGSDHQTFLDNHQEWWAPPDRNSNTKQQGTRKQNHYHSWVDFVTRVKGCINNHTLTVPIGNIAKSTPHVKAKCTSNNLTSTASSSPAASKNPSCSAAAAGHPGRQTQSMSASWTAVLEQDPTQDKQIQQNVHIQALMS